MFNNFLILRKVIILIVCFLIFNNIPLKAQEKEKLKFGLETSPSLSYSGINGNAQVNAFYKNHSLGIGFKMSFKSSYFPYEKSLGFIIEYKYFILTTEKIKSFIAVNYNNVRYNVKNRTYSNRNIIHEFTLSNGFLVKLFDNLWLGNSIGVGGYSERYYNFAIDKKENYAGYNLMLKAIVSYEF